MRYPKASKYGAKKVTVDGITFDSIKECKRWQELKLMERAGVISSLQRQVKFELLPLQRKGGKTERAVSYVADFTYYQDGKLVVEDTKGFRTDTYILKRKMMMFFHDIVIKEV